MTLCEECKYSKAVKSLGLARDLLPTGRRWVITSLSGRASNQRLNESYLAPCNCQLLVKTQAIFDRSSRCKDSAALRLASLADGLALSWLHRVLVNMVSILIRLVGAAFEDRLDFDEQAELED